MVTQKEIAQKLGLSRTTVARAINGSSNIKKETKEKILELVSEMNYQKNYVGSSLASRQKNIVVFLVKSRNLFYTEQLKKGIRAIKEEYKSYNFKMEEITTDIDDTEGQLQKLKEILKREKKVDGILITPLNKKEVFKLLEPHLSDIEIVSVNTNLDDSIPCVGSDYFKEGQIAANIFNKILRKGEKLLILDNGDDHISSGKYLGGLLSKVDSKKIEILGPIKKNSPEESRVFLEEYLSNNKDIRGIYINRYAQDILKKIPIELLEDKDIVATGIGNGIKKLILKDIILATVADDIYEIGYKSGKLLFEILYAGNKKEVEKIVVESKIIFMENLK